jgi:hypothetical protein
MLQLGDIFWCLKEQIIKFANNHDISAKPSPFLMRLLDPLAL